MGEFITKCPECGNTKIFGRLSKWWCGNDDCDATWGDKE